MYSACSRGSSFSYPLKPRRIMFTAIAASSIAMIFEIARMPGRADHASEPIAERKREDDQHQIRRERGERDRHAERLRGRDERGDQRRSGNERHAERHDAEIVRHLFRFRRRVESVRARQE